ncbi:23S rRNA (guanosine(2251)-2'-O)-methyltransferase RlmB [bacterium]|nr:23S rRNA (guanosine(2251)-2'-O)-methyltransferase RlmB [bacterium]
MSKNKKPELKDFVYGVHACLELLTAKRRKVQVVYTQNHEIKAWPKIKKLLPEYVQVQKVSRDVLESMTGVTEHQGVVMFTQPFPVDKKMFSKDHVQFVLVLDEIQDVRNLGAILRSAYCTGVQGVVLCQKNAAPLTPTVFKTSAGLAEYLRIYIAPSMALAVQELKQAGYNLYCAALGGKNIAEIEYTEPVALMIGNEERGISPAIQKQGTAIMIPQKRVDVSYNASVAAGILLFSIGNALKKI